MKARTRFIESVIRTARAQERLELPWARGARRAARIARRREAAQKLKRA